MTTHDEQIVMKALEAAANNLREKAIFLLKQADSLHELRTDYGYHAEEMTRNRIVIIFQCEQAIRSIDPKSVLKEEK